MYVSVIDLQGKGPVGEPGGDGSIILKLILGNIMYKIHLAQDTPADSCEYGKLH